jgi:hypothetical protein
VAFAAVISLSIIILMSLLTLYSVMQAKRSGGPTTVEFRAVGILHFKFGSELGPAHGDRSAFEGERTDSPTDGEKSGGEEAA